MLDTTRWTSLYFQHLFAVIGLKRASLVSSSFYWLLASFTSLHLYLVSTLTSYVVRLLYLLTKDISQQKIGNQTDILPMDCLYSQRTSE